MPKNQEGIDGNRYINSQHNEEDDAFDDVANFVSHDITLFYRLPDTDHKH
jgi:hypothetical protein